MGPRRERAASRDGGVPVVAIGRDGEIQLCEGFHRAAVASVFELDEITVNVLCRHEERQRIRDRIASDPSAARSQEPPIEPREHPDLRDLFPDETR
ncbi:hypothetical protein DJ79_06735 [Halorubrum ezzemoulense]|uniref:ParB/Sulfiredoxin domain-containing protein n=1 Tax=Halorubrum ezzemoulense TaxID=337243 RepID=A0A256JVD5_HALEZ|nr:hypothetical protein DJ79_06735 [Halorubrum ezzemoulense]OYR72332.1 hypothetical protein DJ78_03615 [Halorubrum ezzemoulense]TKX64294.1 hypothetical protein EXE47_12015 [Halorubrum sp. GN12_10-3_MGM]